MNSIFSCCHQTKELKTEFLHRTKKLKTTWLLHEFCFQLFGLMARANEPP
jgi:hypothetical protein